MNFNFLSPVQDLVLAHNELLSTQVLGRKLKVHSKQNGIPDLDDVTIAIIGVLENRNDVNYIGEDLHLSEVRKSLYSLFPGNWYHTVADLGNIEKGETVQDTYFALQTTLEILLEKNIIPIIIGGSQDLTYANYRAYDNILPMVNIVNVDCKFDLGDSSKPIKNDSFLGKVILEKPYNLFNYSTLGYQTYFNSQEEIECDKEVEDRKKGTKFYRIKGTKAWIPDKRYEQNQYLSHMDTPPPGRGCILLSQITSSSEEPTKTDKIHYPTLGVVYSNGANRFSLRYVKQVEGVVCSGGIDLAIELIISLLLPNSGSVSISALGTSLLISP